MSKTYYMHTLDGKPAMFDGDQICFATYFGKANILCASLGQIKREQQATMRYRRRMGFDNYSIGDYGHLRFSPPEANHDR